MHFYPAGLRSPGEHRLSSALSRITNKVERSVRAPDRRNSGRRAARVSQGRLHLVDSKRARCQAPYVLDEGSVRHEASKATRASVALRKPGYPVRDVAATRK